MADQEKLPFPDLSDVIARFRTRPSAWGALAVNLVPIAGVLFWGWNASALMFLYWLENVVIGGFNVLRMGASGAAHGRVGMVSAAILIPFFIFHYGLFCFVHGTFVLVLFGAGLASVQTIGALSGPLDLPQLAAAMFALQPSLQGGLAAIVIWQAIQFGVFYVAAGAYKRIDPISQMIAPYGRILIMHLTIFGAALVVLALGAPLAGVLVLALIKTVFDVGSETRERKLNESGAKGWAAAQSLAQNGFKANPPE